ncbi:MAG: hypothetical protein ACTFAL_07995 [Candidatus Electronema sp. V4]|uniref:hypothetical protein n=1 Tax=Candidatus Electronema sp. V4 TaxID=3454756 RepID=UPI0040554E67
MLNGILWVLCAVGRLARSAPAAPDLPLPVPRMEQERIFQLIVKELAADLQERGDRQDKTRPRELDHGDCGCRPPSFLACASPHEVKPAEKAPDRLINGKTAAVLTQNSCKNNKLS